MTWKIFLILATLLCACKGVHQVSNYPINATDMTYVSTFQLQSSTKIKLEYFERLSDQRDGSVAKITKEIIDIKMIDEVFSLLSSLPDKGEKMVKMGDVSFLQVSLIYSGRVEYFAYYGEVIKTTDTSFYATPLQQEKKLYELLKSLL